MIDLPEWRHGVEFIVHTNRSYLNYIYEREVSHDEYEVQRIFDSGVAQLLFPQDIYEIDIAEKKEAVLRLVQETDRGVLRGGNSGVGAHLWSRRFRRIRPA